MNITDNTYFQYNFEFETENLSYSPQLYNVTIDYAVEPDLTPPTWIIEPQDQEINENEAFSYDIEATDDVGIDTYSINDTDNFMINQSGMIKNNSVLSIGAYNINISVNDTSNNVLSKAISVTVSVINNSPVIHSNITIVNNTEKIPVFGDEFFLQVNVSDPENDSLEMNFTIISPNGSVVIDNQPGDSFSVGNYSVWNSSSYTVDNYGLWNWSYLVSDGVNLVMQNGSFRVFSGLSVFPLAYIVAPDPKNLTLVWNLSMYHDSRESYVLNFTYDLNSTFFTLTFLNDSASISRDVYNTSNLFRNRVTIDIEDSVLEGLIYSGNITITRELDGENYTVPLSIGVNPPSGNIEAFAFSSGNVCSSGNCDYGITMENDESRVFNWIVGNIGDNNLTNCIPNVTGFDISNFGDFSNEGFNLSIGENTTLELSITQPSINTYYGQLEVLCGATDLGYNNSLSSESDNVPAMSILVIADTGGDSPGDSGSPGGGGGSGRVSFWSLELANISLLEMKRGESDFVILEVLNSGSNFLNSCKFVPSGGISNWISNSQIESLASGQIVDFILGLSVPLDAVPGSYFAELNVECEEFSKSTTLNVNVIRGDLEILILNTERIRNSLMIVYLLTDSTGEDQDVVIFYSLLDANGIVVLEGQESVFLPANSQQEYVLELDLPQDSVGDYNLVFSIGDELKGDRAEQKVILSAAPIGGFAIFDIGGTNLRALSWFLGVVIVLAALYFVVKFLYKHHGRIKIHEGKGRHFIKLDLKE